MEYRQLTRALISLLIIGCIVAMVSAYAAAASFTHDVRYSGLNIIGLTVDTAEINSKALADTNNTFDILGRGLVMLSAESISGERQGWIVGGFTSAGKMIGRNHRAELNVSIAGVSIEKLIHSQGCLTFSAGALAGLGVTRLNLLVLSGDVQSWDEARQVGHNNTLNSSFWFFQPFAGARLHVTDYIAIEAKLGLAMSMSDGQWQQGNTKVGNANYSVNGLSLTAGVKAGIF